MQMTGIYFTQQLYLTKRENWQIFLWCDFKLAQKRIWHKYKKVLLTWIHCIIANLTNNRNCYIPVNSYGPLRNMKGIIKYSSITLTRINQTKRGNNFTNNSYCQGYAPIFFYFSSQKHWRKNIVVKRTPRNHYFLVQNIIQISCLTWTVKVL
jgi:hypothetical protein